VADPVSDLEAAAERRGAERVRDRLVELAAEHHQVLDGIEYVEWSLVVTALEEEVNR
jgi:xanthine dehydrogenase molybdopterin-binding subunit B